MFCIHSQTQTRRLVTMAGCFITLTRHIASKSLSRVLSASLILLTAALKAVMWCDEMTRLMTLTSVYIRGAARTKDYERKKDQKHLDWVKITRTVHQEHTTEDAAVYLSVNVCFIGHSELTRWYSGVKGMENKIKDFVMRVMRLCFCDVIALFLLLLLNIR